MSDISIRLIVGLGNPGPQYEATRHNVGFWLADQVAEDYKTNFAMESSLHGQLAKFKTLNGNVYVLKPTTYMNRSGQAVRAVAQFYKISVEEILVLHDELDIPPGEIKLKKGGGHAGHNGLRDIQAQMGSPEFWRLRIGVGHPRTLGLAQQVADYVLHPPRKEDMSLIEGSLTRGRVSIEALLKGDKNLASRALAAPKNG
ncbi:aminoacyl-tRNA hydrolase [Pelistega europaea]|uniref:Peptidyl-tRNA hydrolase n=1 Tax=Pelistega europaea TaxID=106147 RepID=A0A7Y4LE08_9BURK|nr:aminoacyl-tRNA hydrolase [Pelistega europaea]NOL50471.1 aminoacyl-tRNA hydrolase [Pelistega europaea]